MRLESPAGSQSFPLMVLIHVPKTAGSTVNHYLRQSGMPGQDHIEHWLDKPEYAAQKLDSLKWVSGHVSITHMRSFLSGITSRPLRFFSTLRNPKNQIRSHYNWLIEIFHRGDHFYGPHPDEIKEISEKIRGSNNDNPSVIIENLNKYKSLFLNQQSRLVISDDTATFTDPEIAQRLQNYDFVATESRIAELIGVMTGDTPSRTIHENKSSYHFDPAVFDSPEMQAFLASANAVDEAVYTAACR